MKKHTMKNLHKLKQAVLEFTMDTIDLLNNPEIDLIPLEAVMEVQNVKKNKATKVDIELFTTTEKIKYYLDELDKRPHKTLYLPKYAFICLHKNIPRPLTLLKYTHLYTHT